jgi:hypothetical protein
VWLQGLPVNVTALKSELTGTGTMTPGVKKLRDATDAVVGSVFFGTILKAMRNSKLKGEYGHGGRGEEVFGAQLHGVYAERMGGAMQGNLREALLNRLEKQQLLMEKRTGQPLGTDYPGHGVLIRPD